MLYKHTFFFIYTTTAYTVLYSISNSSISFYYFYRYMWKLSEQPVKYKVSPTIKTETKKPKKTRL